MFERKLATGWVALGVFTVGMTVAGLEASNSPLAASVSASKASPVVGQASTYWEPQSGLECAIYASRAVIGARTGQVVTVTELETAAGSAYTPDGGTVMSAVPALLSHYGVKASLVWSDVSSIEAALAHGQSVIGLVNGPRAWQGEDGSNDFEATPAQFDEGVDHALVVDSISNGIVTVTDSAADHRIETMTIAEFEYALNVGPNGSAMAIIAGE